jgi:bacillopeptidase F
MVLMQNYSRLQRKQQRDATRQTYFFIIGSVVVLLIVVFFGIKFVFGLSSAIGERFQKKSQVTVEQKLVPTTPIFSQDFEATNSARVTVSGVTDPKTNIELFQNDESKTTGISDDEGKFSFEVVLVKGENKFAAQAISDSGAKSPMSDTFTVSLLTDPPSLSITSPKDGDTVSNQLTPIMGTTDKGAKVTVNDLFCIVDDKGNFSYGFNFQNGDNKIKVVATDAAGNKTTKEMTVKFSQ